MSTLQKWILGIFLLGILTVIILTWGSVGSAILTLALILAGIFLLLRRSLDEQEQAVEDFQMEE